MDGIPSEIVAEIFFLCLPATNYVRPHPSTAPILLTHVCSSWRAFAFDFPDLWTNIHLTDAWKGSSLLDEVGSLNQMLLRQAELWNRHSRGRLASISLDLAYHTPRKSWKNRERDIPFWHPLVCRVVNENLQTVRHLFIRFNFGSHGLPFYNSSSLEIRDLENLHFAITTETHTATFPPIFSHAPSLRRVIVDVPQGTYNNMQLPWAQLTHLIFVSETPLEFFYFVVEECPLLERLSMNICSYNYVQVSTKVIRLNNLRDLSLTLLHITGPFFINTISFPLLAKLHFFSSIKSNPPHFRWEPLTAGHWDMLHQWRNLHTLVLGYHTIFGDTLLGILRLIPHLVELGVDSDLGTYRSFLQGLTYQPDPEEGHQNILKHLETFRLYIEISGDGRLQPRILDDFARIFDALLVMVLSRSASQSFPRGIFRRNLRASSSEKGAGVCGGHEGITTDHRPQ